MSFEAKYEGRCTNCLERIRPGNAVKFGIEDSFSRRRLVVHVDCEAVAPVERVEVVCDKCFLIKPCGCDDDSAVSRQGEPDALFRSQDGGHVG